MSTWVGFWHHNLDLSGLGFSLRLDPAGRGAFNTWGKSAVNILGGMILRISFYVSLAVLVTLTSCVSGGFESGEYDYNYDSPAAALAETADPAPKPNQEIAPEPEPEPVTVQMRAGDTLYSLSVKHLGTGRRWLEIASLNGFSDAQVTNLSIGQVIRLPAR